MDSADAKDIGTGLLGGGLVTAGANVAGSALEHASKPLQVGLTYGGSNIGIGAGHKEPALALKEMFGEIQNDRLNDQTIPEFELHDLERGTQARPKFLTGPAAGKSMHGGLFSMQDKLRPYDAMVSTGWGIDYASPHAPHLRQHMPIGERLKMYADKMIRPNVAPGGWMGVQNDVGVPGTQWHGYTGGDSLLGYHRSPVRRLAGMFGVRDKEVTWGPAAWSDYEGIGHWSDPLKQMKGVVDRVHTGDAIPTGSQGLVSALESLHNGGGIPAHPAADSLISEMAGKKVLAVSGGGSGIDVMPRAVAAALELKNRGITPDQAVVAALRGGDTKDWISHLLKHSGSKDVWYNYTPQQLADAQPYLREVGRLSRPTFVGLTGGADAHWTYPGASSAQEALASPNKSIVDTFSNVGVKPGSVFHAQSNANEMLRHEGVAKANNVQDVVDHFLGSQRGQFSTRALSHFNDMKSARGMMKEQLVNLLRRQQSLRPIHAAGKVAGGLALGAGGLSLLSNLLGHKKEASAVLPVVDDFFHNRPIHDVERPRDAVQAMAGHSLIGAGVGGIAHSAVNEARARKHGVGEWAQKLNQVKPPSNPLEEADKLNELVSHVDNAAGRAAVAHGHDIVDLRKTLMQNILQHVGVEPTAEQMVAAEKNFSGAGSLMHGLNAVVPKGALAAGAGKNFGELQKTLTGSLESMARSPMGTLGRAKGLLLPALAVGAGYGLMKNSFVNDDTDTGTALASAGMGAAGADQARRAYRDLTNKNVLVTYGDMGELGGGHKSTANNIKAMLERIAERPGPLKGMNIHMGAMSADGKFLRDPSLSTQHYIGSVDPGWGVSDAFRNDRRFMTRNWDVNNNTHAGDTFGVNVNTGETEGNKAMSNRIKQKIIVQPDAMADSGYQMEGIVNRTARHGRDDYSHMWYGTKDPSLVNASAGTPTGYTGRYHPFVGQVPSRLTNKADYVGAVKKYLDEYVPDHGMTTEDLMKRKIFPVSGATRGDTVGMRARIMHEGALKSGLTPEQFLVLGIGADGMERERLIAGSKALVGGRPQGGTEGFVNLAHNGDLGFHGLGGSSPYEFVSHGGSPFVVPKDEQIFKASGPGDGMYGTGSRAYLDPTAGLYKQEVDRLAELKSRIGKGIYTPEQEHMISQMNPQEPRDWMNTRIDAAGRTYDKVNNPVTNAALRKDPGLKGKVIEWAKGLDGIREGLGHHGVAQVSTSDEIAAKLKDIAYMDKGRWANEAASAGKGLRSSSAEAEKFLQKFLEMGRAKSVQAGLKHGGAAAALGLGGLLLPKLLHHEKKASTEDVATPTNLALLGTAGLSASTAQQLHRAKGLGKQMQDLGYDAADLAGSVHTNPEAAARILDRYADISQDLLKLKPIPFVSAGSLFKTLVPPVFTNNIRHPDTVGMDGNYTKGAPMTAWEKWKGLANHALGRDHKNPSTFNWEREWSRDHYNQFAQGKGREALVHEGISGTPMHNAGYVPEWLIKKHGPGTVSDLQDIKPGESLVEYVKRQKPGAVNDTLMARVREMFLGGNKTLLDKSTGKAFTNTDAGTALHHSWQTGRLADLARKTDSKITSPGVRQAVVESGPWLYGQFARRLGKYGVPIAAATGLASLGGIGYNLAHDQ